MALTICPDCGAQISTLAVTCPHCGRPIAISDNLPPLKRPDAHLYFCVKSMFKLGAIAKIFVDGTKVATIRPGNCKNVEVHAGQHEIIVKSGPGKFVIGANVNQGETSYFKLTRNMSTLNSSFLGPIGMLVFAAKSDKSGDFAIQQISEREAKQEFGV